MIDGFNAVCSHDADQAFFVLHGAEQGDDFDLTAGGCLSFAQFFVYAVQGELGQFEQQQFGRAAFQDLAAEFGADGTARTCHHHGFAGNVRAHEFRARGDGVAAEQIDDGDFFQRADFDFAVHQVFHAGNGQHFAFVFFEALDDAAAFFLSGAGDGEQDFFHTVAVDERLDVFRAIDGQVVDDGAADFGVVVHKGDGGIFVDLFDGFQQLAAGLSCAVNDDGHHLFFVAVGQDGAQNHARTGDANDQ